jgi:peptidoglycan/LPS O-acetylase OafA/YrhL
LVLGFHLYPRLVPGGWLGVSLFFTLSGFLITTVILRDLERDTFSFKAFYARRVRRLVPAAVLVLTLFAVTWTVLGWFDENHRSDVLFALLQISNWQQIWEGVPYGTALASPVVHYWSLAIEEQAYLVLPLLIVLSGRARLLKIALGLFALSTLATFLADGSQSIIYFGTHTRAAEVLAGVIAAAFLHNTQWRPQRHIATIISTLGVGYLVWASLFVHLQDSLVYSGGLVVTGVVSASVILALPQSRIATFFDLRPFAWLGTVSYGVYLLHWPILMTLKRTDLPHWSVPLVTLVLTLILSMLMYRTYELPMRFAFSPRKVLAVISVCVVCVAGGFALAKTPPASFEDIENQLEDFSRDSSQNISTFIIGDSRGLTFIQGLINARLMNREPKPMFSISERFTRLGCPIGRGGRIYTKIGIFDFNPKCDWSNLKIPDSDVAVIWGGQWDSVPRDTNQIAGDIFMDLTSPEYSDWLNKEYKELFSNLRILPSLKLIAIVNLNLQDNEQYPALYNEFVRGLTSSNDVVVLDLAGYMERVADNSFLPDGSHVSTGKPTEYSPNDDNSAADLYEKWFEPALCAALLEKAPELLTTKTCPDIDYSPRAKKK